MFDYMIIGSGPAGMSLAYELKGKGASVALVENDKWGGTCPNYGCDPTKVMMAVIEAKHHADQLAGQGLTGDLTIDWKGLRGRKIELTDPFAEGALAGFKQSGIETLYGTAAFTTDGAVEVAGKRYEAKKYIIATGTRPRKLPVEGGELLSTSDDFLAFEELPKSLIILGTGPVSLELAQIAKAAGSDVTVAAVGELKIFHFDEETGAAYLERLKADGIKFVSDFSTTKVEKSAEGLKLTAESGATLTAAAAIAGVGRLANIESLNLDAVGVESKRGGVVVNDHLQTANPKIYAMGDVLAKPLAHLTPVSFFEAAYLGKTLEATNPAAIVYPVIPSVIYGATRLAEVGTLSGEGVSVKSLDMTAWYTYKRIADPFSLAKVAVNAQHEIVGASIVSTVADELVNLLMILIQQKVTVDAFSAMITAYPTVASDLGYLY